MTKLLSSVFAMLVAAAPAHADPAGDKVLAGMDAALNRASSLSFDYEIVQQDAGKSGRSLAMTMKVKGEKRFMEFSSPADMKGTKVLILSPSQMYVFLPAFGKVRRIASHTKDEGFLGLAFSQDDLATSSYSRQYTAKIASESASEWKLVARPRGADAPYAKIEMTVGKDRSLPSELKYFSADGKNTKTETRTGYSCEGAVCAPGEDRMADNTRGTTTKLVRKAWKVNPAIADDVFSQRNLGE